jgi:hypothetical protein
MWKTAENDAQNKLLLYKIFLSHAIQSKFGSTDELFDIA